MILGVRQKAILLNRGFLSGTVGGQSISVKLNNGETELLRWGSPQSGVLKNETSTMFLTRAGDVINKITLIDPSTNAVLSTIDLEGDEIKSYTSNGVFIINIIEIKFR